MSTEFDFDSFMSSTAVVEDDRTVCIEGITRKASELYPLQPGEIDPRLRNLSYSGGQDLHACARLFQLNKLRASGKAANTETESITFAFGHTIGEGIAYIFAGHSWEEIVWKSFLGWGRAEGNLHLHSEDEKSDKSFWSALIALEKFYYMRQSGFLDEYEVLQYQGKPAIELSFKVILPDGFAYRGHVDIVLRHKVTGEIVVIECKTTGLKTINPAVYKNSAQGIGYSVVLDVVAPEANAYTVYYLVYKTGGQEFELFPFPKSYSQRAEWIRTILFDVEHIKQYNEEGLFPKNGDSCVRFWKDCKYLQTCTLSTESMTTPPTWGSLDATEYQINVTLLDLIDSQLRKTGT